MALHHDLINLFHLCRNAQSVIERRSHDLGRDRILKSQSAD